MKAAKLFTISLILNLSSLSFANNYHENITSKDEKSIDLYDQKFKDTKKSGCNCPLKRK